MTRRRWALVGTSVLVVILAAGVWWFEPQALLLDDEVEEVSPGSTVVRRGSMTGVAGHRMQGGAHIVEVGGRRYLRFVDLRGDNGPDLVVYLSAAPADGDADALDDDVVRLGELKGNIGSSNYQLPDGVDLDRYGTAVIWCRRFSVGFAAGQLTASAPR